MSSSLLKTLLPGVGESPNPNLDGDYKELLKLREKRPTIKRAVTNNLASIKEENAVTELKSQPQRKDTVETIGLRDALIESTKENNLEMFKTYYEKTIAQNLSLKDPEFSCDDVSKMTIFHVAVEEESDKIFDFILSQKNFELILSEFEIIVKNTHASKTVLHQLAEQGNLNKIKRLIDVISGHESYKPFTEKAVLMEIERQRPRDLTALHIGALLGFTDIVKYFIEDLKMDVNLRNSKDDTPVLWAARFNHIETVRTLISLQADLSIQNDKGSTPLYWAIRYGLSDLCDVLVTEGKANIHQSRKLGFESPIVLAAAFDYGAILKILLQNGGDINQQVSGGFTALHYACDLGNYDIAEILIQNKANLEVMNDHGDTALTIAAAANESNIVELLSINGANLENSNNQHNTAWSYAIQSTSYELLETLVNCYKTRQKNSPSKNLVFPQGQKNPLHIAAVAEDTNKLRKLLELGCDPNGTDESGNTFYHIAARAGRASVIEAFFKDMIDNVDNVNSDGDTACHLASRMGHYDVIKILVRKAKLNLKNSAGEIPLHVACKSLDTSPELIGLLVSTIVKTQKWEFVDAQDLNGNTALHAAAKSGRHDIFEQLKDLDPRIENKDGDNPFHVAAKLDEPLVLEAMIRTFNTPGSKFNIDQQNGDGETVLHIVAQNGDIEKLEVLLNAGSDLAIQDLTGNTVFHDLMEAGRDDADAERLRATFQLLLLGAAKWWCSKHDIHYPDEESEQFKELKKSAILFLITCVRNNANLSAQDVALKCGSVNLIYDIFHIPNVFLFRDGNAFAYDITGISPKTIVSKTVRMKKISTNNKAKILPQNGISPPAYALKDPNYNNDDESGVACGLELIISHPDPVIANKVLLTTPIRQIVNRYWGAYQFVYSILMVLHIVYMTLFSIYSIPHMSSTLNLQNKTGFSRAKLFPVIMLISWPAIMMLTIIFSIIYEFRQLIKRKKEGLQLHGFRWNIPITWPYALVQALVRVYSYVIGTAFFLAVLLWLIIFMQGRDNQAYALAVALLLGWIYCISYAKAFEAVHSFSIMLSNIILKDVLKFAFVYLFVLMAFSYAFQTLFQLAPAVASQYPSIYDTIFMVFNLMVGFGEIFSEEFDQAFESTGHSSSFVKVVYIGYIALSTIILINLLIAMLSDSYADVKRHEGTTWRVNSVRLALHIDKLVPGLQKFFEKIHLTTTNASYDVINARWQMTISRQSARRPPKIEVTATARAIENLETRLENQVTELSRKLETIQQMVQEMAEQTGRNQTRPVTAGFRRHESDLRKRKLTKKDSLLEASSAAWKGKKGGVDNRGFQA